MNTQRVETGWMQIKSDMTNGSISFGNKKRLDDESDDERTIQRDVPERI